MCDPDSLSKIKCLGAVNLPFLPKPANRHRREIGKSAPPNPENGRLSATGVRWINCRPDRQGRRFRKSFTGSNERALPIADRGGVKVSYGACVTNAPSEHDGAELYER